MDIEQFNKLAQEHRICVCKCCGVTLQTTGTDLTWATDEPVRCPACFQVFVPFPKQEL